MNEDYIHGGDLPARRGVDLRQAKWLDGGMMGHDQMEMVDFGSENSHFCREEKEKKQ